MNWWEVPDKKCRILTAKDDPCNHTNHICDVCEKQKEDMEFFHVEGWILCVECYSRNEMNFGEEWL